eukprot:648605-Heterocapsa_arctica.AAC.1
MSLSRARPPPEAGMGQWRTFMRHSGQLSLASLQVEQISGQSHAFSLAEIIWIFTSGRWSWTQ